ncbi:MAG: (2Fe-2S)-binding protein [Spirochaetes bacterium]|nr:(2Fe-2S)-binding protein [Deltaproteobacteria bacterium]RKY03924.1 MAG: (2Fe-2S)-binding protein [Spirochaetota bacterium]RLA90522.1 MAG: (2Fe-2S)-binding protein [Deltaproteobacteria bacterium]
MKDITISFTLNGKPITIDFPPTMSLLKLLREKLGLLGTKEGCGIGECGACTVLVNGKAVNSCMMLAAQVEGKEVLTIEGLGTKENPDPLQISFVENGAIQCGFCTPGMILSAKALLDKNPNPKREEIKKAIEGNLCRCTGYTAIIEAIEAASRKK